MSRKFAAIDANPSKMGANKSHSNSSNLTVNSPIAVRFRNFAFIILNKKLRTFENIENGMSLAHMRVIDKITDFSTKILLPKLEEEKKSSFKQQF